jgi:hypothetical protein
MIAATARSGQAAPVVKTPMAARTTATLPIGSLRLHSHSDSKLASPERKLIRIRTLTTLAARARSPNILMIKASGTPVTKTRQIVEPKPIFSGQRMIFL